MTVTFKIEEVRAEVQEAKEEILDYMKTIALLQMEDRHKSESKIIATIFSEHKKIREDIGYQTIILKTLEDNMGEIKFEEEASTLSKLEDTGISSKIEVSVGADVYGTGAKWILNIDTGKSSYIEALKAIEYAQGVPNRIKKRAKSKLKTLLN